MVMAEAVGVTAISNSQRHQRHLRSNEMTAAAATAAFSRCRCFLSCFLFSRCRCPPVAARFVVLPGATSSSTTVTLAAAAASLVDAATCATSELPEPLLPHLTLPPLLPPEMSDGAAATSPHPACAATRSASTVSAACTAASAASAAASSSAASAAMSIAAGDVVPPLSATAYCSFDCCQSCHVT